MATPAAQDFLFQRIKEMLPPHLSMVDAVSEILNVSSDSAYRRIRGETPLVLDEAGQLCHHFQLSLDQLLDLKTGAVLFQNTRINNKEYSYAKYLAGLNKQIQNINNFLHKEVIYLTKDIPLFHNFYYSPLIAFRYFFWMKCILEHPDFATRGVDLNGVPPEIETMSRDLVKSYTLIPSVEILNTECVNSAISQVEFFKDSGTFSSAADIRTVYEALEQTIEHLRVQGEFGCKLLPGDEPRGKKNNFRLFFNRVRLGDNTILVKTDHAKSVYLVYDILNYMVTQDETFCNQCHDDLKALMKKSTLISQSSEKQRNIFFGILISKIQDRKRNL